MALNSSMAAIGSACRQDCASQEKLAKLAGEIQRLKAIEKQMLASNRPSEKFVPARPTL
jgi:hypothetical protein